ncbi:two-component regulator propeller domain-containing protein [Inhella gelatinilytica]|uniref:histidine kinase n=1 Tax=Inhella gelatinilytica TaxID=2795030 RepID=A0A931ITA9_9BURK|nr:two-component regulator propeller domain-containing protein [Inhella gelatinilytica]MBH9552340.1 GAF domain-containing protein [Inhella gelatinilytica]
MAAAEFRREGAAGSLCCLGARACSGAFRWRDWGAWILALLLMGGGAARAEPDWSALATPGFRNLSFDDGLPHPIVTALTEDAQGFIWIGTQGGLARYDGYRLRLFTRDPTQGGLSDLYIQALAAAPEGGVWVATRGGGLLRYRPGSDQMENVGGPRGVQALQVQGDTVWLAGDQGLWRYQQGRMEPWVGTGDGGERLQTGLRALALAPNGTLWVGGSRGLVRLTTQGVAQPVGDAQEVTALGVDDEGAVWVGAHGRPLARVHGESGLEPLWRADHPQLARHEVTALVQARPGEMWAAGYGQGIARWPMPAGGVIRHDPGLRGGLASDGVRVLMRDRAGLIWVGGDQGVGRHDPSASAFLNLVASPTGQTGLADRNVVHIGPGRKEGEWLLGYGASGLGRLEVPVNGWVRHERLVFTPRGEEAPPLERARVLATAWEGDVLWVGTLHGLYRVDWARRSAERVPLPTPRRHPRVDALLWDGEQLWVGTLEGLVRRQGGAMRWMAHDPGRHDSLPHDRVNTLRHDAQGRLWVGTNEGLARWIEDDRFEVFPRAPGLPGSLAHDDIVSLAVDRQEHLWVATLGGGVCERQPGTVTRFRCLDRSDGLPHDNVGGLVLDDSGQVWGSTADGVFRVEGQTGQVRAFGAGEGLALRSFWIDAAARTAQGELLFGAGGGVLVVRPQHLQANRTVPHLVITELRVDGHRRPSAQSAFELAPGERAIHVEFAGLQFNAPERLRYRFRLVGLSDDWTETDGSQRVAAFSHLAPGAYRFEVEVWGPGGGTAKQTWPLTVHPAWYQTGWAKVGAVLLGLALLSFWVNRRTRTLQRRQQALEGQVVQRTTELSQANATLARSAETLRLLGDTGRDLTAQLDLQAICATLHRQLAQLLPVDAFGVALLEAESRQLRFLYYFEDKLVQGDTVSLDDPHSLSARAFREDRELDVLDEAQSETAPEVDGIDVGEPMRSLVFRPLQLNDQRIGIVTMQSRLTQAYDANALAIFRNLAAYAAIAIGNARAFEQVAAAQQATEQALDDLRTAQDQLVEQAKLASLGQLVAGVAHEVNTPLGVAVTASSHLMERAREVQGAWRAQKLSRSALDGFLAETEESTVLLQRNLDRASELIAHFKEVSIDRTSDGRREFDLGIYLTELVESLSPSWKRRPIEWVSELEPGLPMDSFPGALGQVITNLVDNALLHAFEPQQPGRLVLQAHALDADRVLLSLRDNGAGMTEAQRQRVFEPFFTTKRGKGGTGLGLHICHNLVVQKLGGSIRVESQPGQGATFWVELPRLAPRGE